MWRSLAYSRNLKAHEVSHHDDSEKDGDTVMVTAAVMLELQKAIECFIWKETQVRSCSRANRVGPKSRARGPPKL